MAFYMEAFLLYSLFYLLSPLTPYLSDEVGNIFGFMQVTGFITLGLMGGILCEYLEYAPLS